MIKRFEHYQDGSIYDEDYLTEVAAENITINDCMNLLTFLYSEEQIFNELSEDIRLTLQEEAIEQYIKDNFVEIKEDDE